MAVVSALGCATKSSMMPAPLAVRLSGADPFALVPPEQRSTTVRVYYATNRAPASPGSNGARYGATLTDEIRLGTATVRLAPQAWDWDRLTSETLAGARPEQSVTGVEELGTLGFATDRNPVASLSADGLPGRAEARFTGTIRSALEACNHRDIFVYVPGINQTFEVGLRRMAEFSHYLDRDGVFLAYAWPAHAHPFAYDADRRHAIASVDGFVRFIRLLEDETEADRIHIITSSAGAPLVSGLLIAMHERQPGAPAPGQTRIGQVIYAASDQDIVAFREMLLNGADEVPEHITIYSSSVDLGLVLTRHFGSGDKTIGRLPANLSDPTASVLRSHSARVTVVDATVAVHYAGRGDMWAHRYWYLNPWVSSDLLAVLRHGLAPDERGLVAGHEGALWCFPPDYPDRLRAEMAACPLAGQAQAAR
ncbi:MAG: alpha/beta hydrolase [Phycisphaerales bacterium]|nr:alpha/beta hydrolase [Phycisphaerales bacterium]